MDQVPGRGVHGGKVGAAAAGSPGRGQFPAADRGRPRLVLDVHRRDQPIGRIAPGDVLPGRGELRGRPAVVVPQAIVVVAGAAPAAEQHVAVRDDDQPRAGQRGHAGVIDLHGG